NSVFERCAPAMLFGPGGRMNGYLTNLLARSRGTADVMRPRIASFFESVQPEPPMMPETQPTRAIEEREEDAPPVERRAIALDTPQQKPLERERPEAPAAI